ncbi:hypothetical protein HYX06_06490 [Candidatus Woesearchaeota archaeon]|nr:hypothetical protein [Candidatus Woesearchaeota archaeon]
MDFNKESYIPREFHLWNLPDNLFFLFKKEANDKFFKRMYSTFGTQHKFADFLNLYRQEVNKYHKQILKNRGKYYPVYIPIVLFKRCVPIIEKDFIYYLEQNVSEVRVRVGLSIYNPRLPIRESEEVYRIIAHMIADGSAGKGQIPYYANTCKELREQFKRDLQIFGSMKTYERKPNTTEIIFFPKAVTDILAHLFDVKFTYPDRLPKIIFTTDTKFKRTFLQALFDDEGTITAQLAIGIHNINIMSEIKSLINSLCINTSKIFIHHIPDLTDKVYLCVPKSEYKLFQQEIGFSHPEKARKLELTIMTQNRKQRTRDPKYIEQEILKMLDMQPLPTFDLANELMFTINGLRPHLDKMLEEGLIIKRGYKNKLIWDIA